MQITNKQISEAYIQAKLVYAGDLSLAKAKENIAEATGMNERSAQGYIHTFLKIMEGAGYTRTINAYGTDYYLEHIYTDYGLDALMTAISSVKKHLEYYEGVGKSSQPKIHKVLNKFLERVDHLGTFDEVQRSFEKQVTLSLADSNETRASRLKAAITKPRESEVTVKIYSRNPDVVAEVLHRAKGLCEKCGNPAPFNRAKDHTPYLEVHHINLLSQGGDDIVENAMALCPNCHREFHFGV